MMNIIELHPDTTIDLYSTAHNLIVHQGENAVELLRAEAEALRRNSTAEEDLYACIELMRVVNELIDMEIGGPIH
ncbi:hypothetical protein GQF03_01765 [Sneathiella chungangensis]|uniref:Uncharacterized protein n=1 Tax=Sneathiella chungangensis TaxID=1418234 RepID=A0A845MBB6_9PROT|nr:hypothetical protein [Sneathiella chungangensis]MZR21051.1 hypothetical protein [Sneathiella chungangensis]